MDNQVPIYAKIDEPVKDRATMYVAKCKLLKRKPDSMKLLIEESIDEYMMNHPI